MEQNNTHTTFPSWDELNQLFNGSLSEIDALQLLERIRSTTPEGEAAIGLKKWLEKNDYELPKLKQWVARSQNHLPSSTSARQPLPLKVAASIAILLATSYFAYQFLITNKAPWNNYYAMDSESPTLMGKSSQKSLWIELYCSGNSKETLSKIHFAQAEESTNDTLLFYKAIVLFENNAAKDALLELQKINYSQSHLRTEINYLSAFCYLQLKDKAMAKLLFERIVKEKKAN
jgi:hypothetical protein